MTGLIWLTQLVYYLLFDRVNRSAYPAFQREHERRVLWVVGTLMPLEGLTAALLLWRKPHGASAAWLYVNFALLVLIWLSTAFLQIPLHRRLESGFDPAAHLRLVASNWLRTAVWSARSAILFGILLPQSFLRF